MKNAIAFLLLLPFLATAQNNLITINLADTVHVVGEELVYMISSYSNDYEEGMPVDIAPTSGVSDLEIWLKAKSIPYEANDLMGYGGGANGFYLKFKSLKEMEAVTKDLKAKIPNSVGWLVQVSAKESEKHYEKLLDKLMQKAKTSAELVAKKMGKSNLVIVEVSFTRGGGEVGGYVAYPPMSALPQDPSAYTDDNMKGKTTVGGSLQIKYMAN